jgi:hypothetical protein
MKHGMQDTGDLVCTNITSNAFGIAIGRAVTKGIESSGLEFVVRRGVPVAVDEDGVLPDMRHIDTQVRNDNDGGTAIDTVDACRTFTSERRSAEPVSSCGSSLIHPKGGEGGDVERVGRHVIVERSSH